MPQGKPVSHTLYHTSHISVLHLENCTANKVTLASQSNYNFSKVKI